MKDKLTEQQTTDILKALDAILEEGPWEKSNFLRVIGKNLQEIRTNLASQVASLDNQTALTAAIQEKNRTARATQREVFVSLYSTEGANLQVWERILASLPRQMISRPIYENERDIENLIKAKENRINEAYVSIYVEHEDILTVPTDKTPVDKLGKPLLSLKDRCINVNNINRFVHISNVYHYLKGHLLKQDD